ncbi:MAG: LOG family protein [Candidatus Omnitrophica bacterium]|nr:LOG family protein [Candidatus Omnitrophota bacterium]
MKKAVSSSRHSKVVTVFGSGQLNHKTSEYTQAVELGRLLAEAGLTVCNGGYGGIMEASACGARQAGGRTVGIMSGSFAHKANAWIMETERFATWHERLLRLVEIADAYVICDGGTGTLVELFMVWEIANKHKVQKPFILLGQQMQSLSNYLKSNPYIIFHPCLHYAQTPEEAVRLIP